MTSVLSLCSGYGGLDLALEEVLDDVQVVAVADTDEGAATVLDVRYPDAPNLGDVKSIAWEEWAGVDVMTAGYPCQPFSTAGKQAGTDDPRHLFPAIAEGIRRVGPRLVVLENVRGHLSVGFDTVVGALADLGYDARWTCLRASDVGAPHHRDRLFIVAAPHTGGGVGEVPAIGQLPAVQQPRGNGDPWGGREAAPDTRGQARGERTGLRPCRSTPVGVGRPDHGGSQAPADADQVGRSHGRGRSGRSHPDRRPRVREDVDWGPYRPAVTRWEAAMGRPAPAPTVRAPKGGRGLSPRFVEWMMGLPEGWVTDVPGLTHRAQRQLLGNGVCPPQAATALAYLLKLEEVAA